MFSYTINDLIDHERLCLVSKTFRPPNNIKNIMKKKGYWKGTEYLISIIDHEEGKKMSFRYHPDKKGWSFDYTTLKVTADQDVVFLIN